MLNALKIPHALKIGLAATTIAVSALALSGSAQARFGAGPAAETEALLQPAHYYGYRSYGYGYRGGYGYYGGYYPRYYGGYGYGYRGYYAPRYYRYY